MKVDRRSLFKVAAALAFMSREVLIDSAMWTFDGGTLPVGSMFEWCQVNNVNEKVWSCSFLMEEAANFSRYEVFKCTDGYVAYLYDDLKSICKRAPIVGDYDFYLRMLNNG